MSFSCFFSATVCRPWSLIQLLSEPKLNRSVYTRCRLSFYSFSCVYVCMHWCNFFRGRLHRRNSYDEMWKVRGCYKRQALSYIWRFEVLLPSWWQVHICLLFFEHGLMAKGFNQNVWSAGEYNLSCCQHDTSLQANPKTHTEPPEVPPEVPYVRIWYAIETCTGEKAYYCSTRALQVTAPMLPLTNCSE